MASWLNSRAQIDPFLAAAVCEFQKSWGPYTERSRRYPLFRLFRELIDPAWEVFCSRTPALAQARLLSCWNCYTKTKHLAAAVDDRGTGKEQQSVCLSDIARQYGFDKLSHFLEQLLAQLYGVEKSSVEYLRDAVDACFLKSGEKVTVGQAMAVNVENHDPTCKFCGGKTELFSYLDGDIPLPKDAAGRRARHGARLSTLFCTEHRSRTSGYSTVNGSYRTAKRNEENFLREAARLDTQSLFWDEEAPYAESGNLLVDEFLFRLVDATRLGVDLWAEGYEARVRSQARDLIQLRISDRKKEIVALLAKGNSQSFIARQLGISRQAVSKALKSLPASYRFDLTARDRRLLPP